MPQPMKREITHGLPCLLRKKRIMKYRMVRLPMRSHIKDFVLTKTKLSMYFMSQMKKKR